MAAVLKDYDDNYYTYENAKEVKERNGQYVIYDAYGNVLAVHPIEEVEKLVTDGPGGEFQKEVK